MTLSDWWGILRGGSFEWYLSRLDALLADMHARSARHRFATPCSAVASHLVVSAAAALLLHGASEPTQHPTTLLPPQARARGAGGAQRRRLGCPTAAG